MQMKYPWNKSLPSQVLFGTIILGSLFANNSGSAIQKVDDCQVSRVMAINTRELAIGYLTSSIPKGEI